MSGGIEGQIAACFERAEAYAEEVVAELDERRGGRMAWMDGDADWVEPAEQVENLTLVDTRHWGCWHPERGWMSSHEGELFMTTNKAVAQAQCDVTRRWTSNYFDASLYEVRCIEEWADEQLG